MISELRLTNFTRFSKVGLNFSEGLNVFVGTNGTGKSHIIKLMYANHQAMRKEKDGPEAPTMVHLGTKVAQRLVGVFKPDALGRLARRCQGHTRTQVATRARGVPLPQGAGAVIYVLYTLTDHGKCGAHPADMERLPECVPAHPRDALYLPELHIHVRSRGNPL